MEKVLKPPPVRKKDDLSDELSKMFDDGTVLESERQVAPPVEPREMPIDTPRLTSAQPGSAHLGSPQLSTAEANQSPPPSRRKKAAVAADRDFNRRPNSLERDALPAGLFPGTSKKLYDALFLRTRGAHNPTRTIQATRSELMRWAGIGSRNTFLSHMRHLTRVGLLIRRFEVGNNEGAEYEVCIPEELDLSNLSTSAQLSSAHLGSTRLDSAQNLALGSDQKVGRAEPSQTPEQTEDVLAPNTSFKTTTNDDDRAVALSDLNKIFCEASRKLTGRDPKPAERAQWAQLAQVLVDELNEAAARAGGVSSVPAFLAAHLKRRLAQKSSSTKGEGKGKKASTKKLSDKDLQETASSYVDLISDGAYTLESLEERYASEWHPDNWAKIRSMIITLLEKK